jgi:hypothetical protein
MAAVFLLLGGGTNALANTIWCVTKTAVVPNPACTPATTFSTISGVFYTPRPTPPGPVLPFDVIVVAPGYYNESVLIPVDNVSLFGAQAGKDARVGRHGGESIVDATNQESGAPPATGLGAAFFVGGDHVTIDGFTIEGGGVVTPPTSLGGYASGIFAPAAGARILNNIIKNNAVGVFSASAYGLVEYNLFKTNNAGKAGASLAPLSLMWGFGLAQISAAGVAITENEFKGNGAAALFVYEATASNVTKNTSENDGALGVILECTFCSFSHNQGQDFCPNLPVTGVGGQQADAAIDVGYNTALQINDNDLEEGRTTGYSGIAFTTIFGPGVCSNCEVSNNTVKRFAGNGIVAETKGTLPGSPTLGSSMISGNDVEHNGNDGILIEEGDGNYHNTVADNQAEGNHMYDCEDDTYLITPPPFSPITGTAGTANTWFNNIGSLSDPAGLCAIPTPTWH